MSVTVGVSYAAIATREKLRGGIGLTKVRRYWPGKAPEWAEEGEGDKDVDALDKNFQRNDDLGFGRKDDPRLLRLAQTRSENREQVRSDHQRVIQKPEIISAEEEKEESRNQETRDEGEDALEERRRRRIREKNLKRTQEEADLLPVEEEEIQDEEEEEEEEEYETDSEYEIVGIITMSKPFFVRRSERDTVTEREQIEAEEEALKELAKRKLEMRKTETKQIVVEEVRKYQEMRKNMVLGEANLRDLETDDEIDEAEEYEAWKTRETARIKREKDAKEVMLREKEDIDKLKNMTEEEGKNPNPKPLSSTQPKKKWKFMQRYYHKGAFFQEDDIFQRDFSAPTGDDKLDKSKLHKILQVKKFGHSGRTKWTRLLNEDTTGKGNQWTLIDPLCEKYKRMAGMDALIAKPKGSKKMKAWEY